MVLGLSPKKASGSVNTVQLLFMMDSVPMITGVFHGTYKAVARELSRAKVVRVYPYL